MISLIAVVISFLIGTSKAFYVKSNGNEIISGNITGTLTDFQIMNIYVDGNETNTMPTGDYSIDEENSYCYISDPLIHDSNVNLYTNSNGEHIIGGFTKGEKCVLYFESKVLITFTIDNQELTAEEGMTWGEWIASEYNTTNIGNPICESYITFVENNKLYYINYNGSQTISDIIINDRSYSSIQKTTCIYGGGY